MIAPHKSLPLVAMAAFCAIQLLPAVASAAAPAPHWSISSVRGPTNFIPGDSGGNDVYRIVATNTGASPTDGTPITITDTLPAGLTLNPAPANTFLTFAAFQKNSPSPCDPGPPVSCSLNTTVAPGERLVAFVPVDVDSDLDGSTVSNQVSISGGGAPAASDIEPTPVSSTAAGPGFQFFTTSLTDPAGDPVTQAGSHPYRFNLSFQLNSVFGSAGNPPAGSPRNVHTELPRGFIVNPTATPVRCTEAELETGVTGSCPDASAVGEFQPTQNLFGYTDSIDLASPVYSMVPPPGVPAELGLNAATFGIFVHLLGGVDGAGNYSLTADVEDITQYGQISGVSIDLWGDPSDPSHDGTRGQCGVNFPNGSCPVAPSDSPFLTMPSACSGPLVSSLTVTSWEDPGNPFLVTTGTRDSHGNPVGVTGCSQLGFDPTLTAQPTTSEADSPTGLDVDLRVPQTNSSDTLATANLKRTVVDLPTGMAVNPSSADGLGACSPAQIGLTTPIGQPNAHFTADPDSCPDSAKVGSVQITTPLLADPLQGSVYLASQDANPFPNPSLLALYITIKDPATGLVIKLPGKVSPGPQTGQLHAVFDNAPELPFSDFALHFKSGNRATLITPPSCGTYTTTSKLAPWSAADPDNPTPAETKTWTDSFQITTGPGGGPCPDYLDPARFTPSFSAGTVSPQAGTSSPFVLNISRRDGQQSLKQIHLDLPPGLLANLNGVPKCPQSQVQSGVGGHANCPPGSQIGIVDAGAGAGGTPFYLTGQPVYLTDGYNGAPYGIAIDTDLLAGPFDLGHLVIRSTLNVDPDDAQVHIDSEQLPDIIDGIPLHIRDIRVNINKPGFMLNPTNCNPQQLTGTITGGGADFANPADDTTKPVSQYFQVSGCGSLGFSPHLAGTILNGAQGIHRSDHPNLSFNLHGTPGDSNLAAVSVLLPQAFQIDQANLGNICSETQLATQECAGRNAVGTASATTPLLGSTLSGPVYAVSGSGGLPKLAVILHGPPADPVKLLVRGITSTVGARIENTFPLVPDAPVTSFNLTLNGGPTGYLVNNTDVCAHAKGHSRKAHKRASRLRRTNLTADASFTAQDGDTLSQAVPISAQCPKAKKSNRRAMKHQRH